MTTRKRIRYAEGPQLSSAERELLLTGTWLRNDPEPSEAKLRELWTKHRDELLAEWFRREPRLFFRPQAWWDFDAPEGRRLISGKANLDTGRDWFGTPSAGDAEEYETQFSYLRRHPELQTPAERVMKLSLATIQWRSLPASEMAEEQWLLEHPELLKAAELRALQEHIKATEITGPAEDTIQ